MMGRQRDEYELAVRAGKGDPNALAELVEGLRLWLFAVAYGDLQHYEDARDAVASALLRICLHVREVRHPEQMRAWMQTIVRNEARRLQRRPTMALPLVCIEELPAEPALPETTHLRLDVERALRVLPRDQARVLALFYLANVPIREIARRTGRPVGTIKSWLHHGRRRLAQAMQEYAPMTPRKWNAAIISTDLDGEVRNGLTRALRDAGFANVTHLDNYREVAFLEKTGEGTANELHLPASLQGTDFVILDEWIGGRSAFELFPILRAAKGDLAACILLDRTDAETNHVSILASWVSGFDLCLTKPVDPGEFQRLAGRIREGLEARSGANAT